MAQFFKAVKVDLMLQMFGWTHQMCCVILHVPSWIMIFKKRLLLVFFFLIDKKSPSKTQLCISLSACLLC